MKNILILSVALSTTCLIAGFILIQANELTYEARKQARLAEQFAAMRAVFPECEFTEKTEPLEVKTADGNFLFYPARKEGSLQGLAAFGTSDKGYGSTLRVLVGIDLDTEAVRKVVVVEHGETPGLGSQVTDRKETRNLWDLWRSNGKKESDPEEGDGDNGLPANRYLDQFNQRSLPGQGMFRVVNSPEAVDDRHRDVVAVSGATISSQAVADAVGRILAACQEHKEKILTELKKQEPSL